MRTQVGPTPGKGDRDRIEARPQEGKGDEPMKTHVLLIASCLMAATAARHSFALGLGELTLSSYLNEPFRAEVPLLEADLLDDNDVQVGLAPDADFSRFGLDRVFFLTDIRFEIQSDLSGKRVILSTDTPLREPYLDFIIEARWPDGRLLREYTVLIDLPPRPAGPALPPVVSDLESEEVVSSADSAGEAADAGRYLASAELRPVPGASYLVKNNDTLWRIAADGAADGISVQQTMLEIVAANPEAFQRGNINGLKSGYVLQIPRAEDIQAGPAAALNEVARQHEVWARGMMPAAQGLRLVADTEPEPEPAPTSPKDTGALDPSLLPMEAPAAAAELPQDILPAEASPEVAESELDSLMAAVDRLQVNVQSLQARLAEKDVELAELWRALAKKEAELAAAMAVEGATPSATSRPSDSLPVWPFMVGLAALLAGAGSLIWRRRLAGRQALVADLAEGKPESRPEEQTDAGGLSRLTDPQIMASKAVEEAEIYIAYGRTDQAVEVLQIARAQGLSSPAINLSLLECYAELEQFAEAASVLNQLESAGDPELLERARQIMLDAGTVSSFGAADASVDSADAAVPESDQASALSEFSFSTDPGFDLASQSAPLAEATDDQPLEPLEQDVDTVRAVDYPHDDEASPAVAEAVTAPDSSGLSLAPLDRGPGDAGEAADEGLESDASIYGAETDPIDSKLDLARAYIDMGDEEGAQPVLMEVIKEGGLAQQAEARELLLRLETS